MTFGFGTFLAWQLAITPDLGGTATLASPGYSLSFDRYRGDCLGCGIDMSRTVVSCQGVTNAYM